MDVKTALEVLRVGVGDIPYPGGRDYSQRALATVAQSVHAMACVLQRAGVLDDTDVIPIRTLLEAVESQTTLTAFCQDASGEGTIWIDAVYIQTPGGRLGEGEIDKARELAREACAADWGRASIESVHCLGLARGDVRIVDWQDI